MLKPNKPSLLEKLEATAVKLGEAATKALDKSNAARKDAAAKVALYENAAKVLLKEAKAVAKTGGPSVAGAQKTASKKTAVKKVGAKKATTKAASPSVPSAAPAP
jgi:hypothetical protein